MIKSYSLYTAEIDIADGAVSDILAQMKDVQLLQHSVGIVACHYDAVGSGVVAGISEALPFPLIGFTTFYQATPDTSDHFELTITVITSDDVRFVTCHSTPDDGHLDPESRLQSTYAKGVEQCGEAPSLIMSFLSVSRPVTGDEFLRLLDDASGSVPCFGCVTTGDDDSGDNMYVICDGQVFSEGFALLLFCGDAHPQFYFGSYLDEFLLEATATVTQADGVVVHKLNNQPAATYLERSGIELSDESRPGLITVPILHKRPGEDVLVARTMVDYDENGSAIFFAEIPEGSTFRVAACGTDDILEATSTTAAKAIVENPDAGLMLLFSCIGRYISLGLGSASELGCSTAAIPEGIPYLAAYVGGEICPIASGGQLINRYHNSSFVICVLKYTEHHI